MPRVTLDIKTPDGVCDAYLSCPDAGGPFPPVLFFMDGIGIRKVLHEMADRIAASGYCVLLPNMFYRSGRAPLFEVAEILKPENRPQLMKYILGVTPDAVLSDAKVFLDFLGARKEVMPGAKAGLTGYCMGGSMVVRTAAAYPDRIAAGASFHAGRLVSDASDSPHKLLANVTAELYFGHADQDAGMTTADIKTLEDALQTAGTKYESELCAGAIHGYTMPDLPPYNAAATDKHWGRLLGLFGKTLKAAHA